MRSASQRHPHRGAGSQPEYLAFTTWRPGARLHLVTVPPGTSVGSEVHHYESLCGLTPEKTHEAAALNTGRPATEEEIAHEAAMPGFLCTRCYRRHREERA